jgi:hypothetical protein
MGLPVAGTKMLVNRKFDAIAVVGIIGLVGYVALQPQYRLRPDPPPEFIREAHSMSPQKRAAEERIARAYWRCAVTDVQWHYGYAHRLPQNAPVEFMISSQEFGPAASDSDARARYWNKLQEVWYMRTVWNKEYGWNFRSLSEAFEAAGRWFEEHVTRFFHA